MTIEFDYEISKKVKIVDIGVYGFVVGYYYGETGKQYEVAYFVDGEMRKTFLYPFQISTCDTSNVGFFDIR